MRFRAYAVRHAALRLLALGVSIVWDSIDYVADALVNSQLSLLPADVTRLRIRHPLVTSRVPRFQHPYVAFARTPFERITAAVWTVLSDALDNVTSSLLAYVLVGPIRALSAIALSPSLVVWLSITLMNAALTPSTSAKKRKALPRSYRESSSGPRVQKISKAQELMYPDLIFLSSDSEEEQLDRQPSPKQVFVPMEKSLSTAAPQLLEPVASTSSESRACRPTHQSEKTIPADQPYLLPLLHPVPDSSMLSETGISHLGEAAVEFDVNKIAVPADDNHSHNDVEVSSDEQRKHSSASFKCAADGNDRENENRNRTSRPSFNAPPPPEVLRKKEPLTYNGFKFHCAHKERKNRPMVWYCSRMESDSCSASFKCAADGSDFVDIRPHHTHLSIKTRRIVQTVKQAAPSNFMQGLATERPHTAAPQPTVPATSVSTDMSSSRPRRLAAVTAAERTTEIVFELDHSQSAQEDSASDASVGENESEDGLHDEALNGSELKGSGDTCQLPSPSAMVDSSTDRPSREALVSGKPFTYKGFRYNRSWMRYGTMYWVCTRSRPPTKCPAKIRCTADGDDFDDSNATTHNHTPQITLNCDNDTKYGLPIKTYNALNKKERIAVVRAYHGQTKVPKPNGKKAGFIPSSVRRKPRRHTSITTSTPHLRCPACGSCVPYCMENTHVSSCIVSLNKELAVCVGAAQADTGKLKPCTCCETGGRVVDDHFRSPALSEAMNNPNFALSLTVDPEFENFKHTVAKMRAHDTWKSKEHNVYIQVEVDRDHRNLSFAEMINAAFYVGESANALERSASHIVNSTTITPNSPKSKAFISHRILNGIKSNGRAQIYLVPLTLGGPDGQNLVDFGCALESLTMLVMGMPTLVNTRFYLTRSFDDRTKSFFKHTDTIITALLYTTWREVFAAGSLDAPYAFELTDIERVQKRVDYNSARRLDSTIHEFRNRAGLQLVNDPVDDGRERQTSAIVYTEIQRIMEFTVADEEEVLHVINGTDEFFDAACVTRFICVAVLASAKKAIVVKPMYSNAILNGLVNPERASLIRSCFNYSEDATIVLIPFSTSSNDNGKIIAHWTIFIADRSRNALIIYDPLGNTTPCKRQFSIVMSTIRDLFYDGADELAITNCSNLTRNKQTDGTSCGVYVSELAAHYLFTSHSHCLPVATSRQLRQHATGILEGLGNASSMSTGLHCMSLIQWLDEHRSSTENQSSPGASRDSGVFDEDDYSLMITSDAFSPPTHPATPVIARSPETSTMTRNTMLGRITEHVASCRRKLKRKELCLISKRSAVVHHAENSYKAVRWERDRKALVSRCEQAIQEISKQVKDLRSARVIYYALWDIYACSSDSERRFEQFKATIPVRLVQVFEAFAQFWSVQTSEMKNKVLCTLKRHAATEFKTDPENLDGWHEAYSTVDDIDALFAKYLHMSKSGEHLSNTESSDVNPLDL